MNELFYRLFLFNEQGWSIYGTLRLRYLPPEARAAAPGALASQLAQQSTIELGAVPVEGSVTIPLLYGLRSVPIAGIALISPVSLFCYLLSSTGSEPSVAMQVLLLGGQDLTGNLIWRDQSREYVFGMLVMPMQANI